MSIDSPVSSPRRSPDGMPNFLTRFTGLLIEQVRNWNVGDRRTVEDYLAEYPGLCTQKEVVGGLAAVEFQLRCLDGEKPSLEDFRKRLPEWADVVTRAIRPLEKGMLRISPTPLSSHEFSHKSLFPPDPVPAIEVPASSFSRVSPQIVNVLPEVPGYEILDELGEGGMAIVYLAKQLRLNRLVALKMLHAGSIGPINAVRFEKEAEMVASLQHPNIVQIHDVGHTGERLYLALEYMPGGSVDVKWDGRPQPPDEVGRLVATVARAVHHAHENGILHRDLKPANILIARDGTLKITDFGLAKQTDAPVRLTDTGLMVGTPCYMAPEQVWPKPEDIGPTTDVYSLGCIFYEGLTGRPPHVGKTCLDTLRQVTDRDPIPVRRLNPSVPVALETICLKCLEKSIQNRYASATELAEDLDRYFVGKPLQAKPLGHFERGLRWSKQHGTLVALSLSLSLAVVAVVLAMAWSTYHAYRVAGALRDREFRLHGLGAKLRQLSADAGKAVSIAAAANEPGRLVEYYSLEEEHATTLADAVFLAPGPAENANLVAATDRVRTLRERTAKNVALGDAKLGWSLIDSPAYARMRTDYAVAVDAFSTQVDAAADAELRSVRAETYWSLRAATLVAGMLGLLGVGFLLRGLRRREELNSQTHLPEVLPKR